MIRRPTPSGQDIRHILGRKSDLARPRGLRAGKLTRDAENDKGVRIHAATIYTAPLICYASSAGMGCRIRTGHHTPPRVYLPPAETIRL